VAWLWIYVVLQQADGRKTAVIRGAESITAYIHYYMSCSEMIHKISTIGSSSNIKSHEFLNETNLIIYFSTEAIAVIQELDLLTTVDR
jgi:hypothetical protein